MFIGYAARACSSSATRPNHTLIRPARTGWATRCVAGLLVVGHSLGRGGLDLAEVPGVLVVEASRHSAAELQPVLLELPHVCPFLNAWPVGLPCPWTRGTVATVACRKSTRGKRYSQRSRPSGQARRPWRARVPGWLVGRLRLGVGHAIYRPARSLHPGRGGRTRLPTTRAARSSSQATTATG